MKTSGTDASELIVELSEHIAFLEINRPEKRNSLSPQVLEAIVGALQDFAGDRSVRCVVLSGRGGKAFSSGYDFSFIGSRDMMRDYETEKHPLAAACEAIESFPRPVLAMVQGYAVGGGLELAVSCDFIICSGDSKFSMPPASLGIAYPLSGLKRVAGAVGCPEAKRIFFASETFTAERAFQAGLVSEVVPSGLLRRRTREIALRIAGNAPLSLESAKAGLNVCKNPAAPSPQKVAAVKQTVQRAQDSADFKEGMKSVSEKRKPVFRGG